MGVSNGRFQYMYVTILTVVNYNFATDLQTPTGGVSSVTSLSIVCSKLASSTQAAGGYYPLGSKGNMVSTQHRMPSQKYN